MRGSRTNWLKLPDPTIIKQGVPIKGLLRWDDLIITGNDKGEIRLYDKELNELLNYTALKSPILSLQR